MRIHGRRTATGLALAAATALSLTACGGGSDAASSTSSSSSAAAPSTAASSPSASGTSVNVTEKEFAITMPKTDFAAGTYTFKVTNNGKFPHNLTIDGPGLEDKASPTNKPGKSGDVTATLQKGSYEFYCSVDGHKGKGMDMKITVT